MLMVSPAIILSALDNSYFNLTGPRSCFLIFWMLMKETQLDVENNQRDYVLTEMEVTRRGVFLCVFFPIVFLLTFTQVSSNGLWLQTPYPKEKQPLHKYLAHASEIAVLHT